MARWEGQVTKATTGQNHMMHPQDRADFRDEARGPRLSDQPCIQPLN